MLSCLITALIARLKLTARNRALLVNGTAYVLPNFTGQSNAAFVQLMGSAHGDIMVVNQFCELLWNRTLWVCRGLTPIK